MNTELSKPTAISAEGDVEFYEDTHEYWLVDDAGFRRSAISVTQAMKEGGLEDERVSPFWTDNGRRRGSDIHDALLFYHLTGSQPFLIDDRVPYWEAIMRFLACGEFELELMEQVIGDHVLGYGGRFDVLGRLRRYMTHPDPSVDRGRDLIDVKLGTVPRTVKPQTMGYRRRIRRYPLVRRWALEVNPGRYRLVPLNLDPATGRIDRLEDVRDEQLFLAALTVAHFRREHYRAR